MACMESPGQSGCLWGAGFVFLPAKGVPMYEKKPWESVDKESD